MPVTINHGLTATTPDNTSYEIRPSHWNQTHAATVNVVGSEVISAFNNAGGVTFGLATNGSITASAPAAAPSPVNVSAGTTSGNLVSVVFSNSNNVSFGLSGSTITASATAHATNIGIEQIGSTHVLDDLLTDVLSAGWNSGGEITDAGSGNVDIAAGDGLIRSANTSTSKLYHVSWSASNGNAIPSNSTRYVHVFYNSGSPTVTIDATNHEEDRRYIYLGEVHNIGGTLQIHFDPRPAGDGFGKFNDWVHEVIGNRVVSGEITSDPSAPSRKLRVTAGVFWDAHLKQYSDSTVDTSGAGTFTTYYRNGSGDWTRTASVTDWPNNKWDNGSGTLQTMTSGYYSNLWVIRSFLGHVAVMYGQAEYDSAENALLELAPSRPEEFDEHGFFVARLTFQESGTSPHTITDRRPYINFESGGGGGGAADGVNILAAGTQTANTAATVMFANSNGITFGMSGSSQITASHNGLTTAALSDHSHGNPTLALTNLSGTTASNSAGFTLSLSAGAGGAGDGVNILAAGTQTANTTGTVNFANSNGITFGMSNNSQITASHNGLTSQSNQAVSGANGSFTFQTLSLANSNGVSWSTGTQGLYATVKTDYLTTARASNDAVGLNTALTAGPLAWTVNSAGISLNAGSAAGTTTGFAGVNISGSMTHNTAGLNLSLSVGAGGAGDGVNILAAGSQTANTTGSVLFQNSNNVTFGMSNSSVITASFNPINIGISNVGNTAGTSGTIDGAGAQYVFAGGPNVTVSQSINGSSATLSISAAAGGGGATISRYVNEPGITNVGTVIGNSIVSVFPFQLLNQLDASNMRFGVSQGVASQTNNSSAFVDLSCSAVFYTRNGSTLSSIGSGSNTYTATWSSNATGTVAGARGLTMTLGGSTNWTPGEYWCALHVSTTNTATGGAATTALGNSVSLMIGATVGSAAVGLDPYFSATAASRGASIGLGAISTGVTRATIPFSEITQTGTRAICAKVWMDLRNYTLW